MTLIPMMIPWDRPVTWREFTASESEDPEEFMRECSSMEIEAPSLDEILNFLIDRHEAILTATATSLGVPIPEIVSAANSGRIRWLSEYTPCRSEPVRASLDGGPWIQVPGIVNSGQTAMPALSR